MSSDSVVIISEFDFSEGKSLKQHLADVEKKVILETLASSLGNVSLTARRLRLNRGTLINRLKKYGKKE